MATAFELEGDAVAIIVIEHNAVGAVRVLCRADSHIGGFIALDADTCRTGFESLGT